MMNYEKRVDISDSQRSVVAKITTKIFKDRDIAIIKVTGYFTREQIIDAINKSSGPDFPKTHIWDLSGTDMSSINSEDMRVIAVTGKKYEHFREGGKTAIVQSDDLGFGLTRMYEALADIEGFSIPINVFRNLEDAMHWIDS